MRDPKTDPQPDDLIEFRNGYWIKVLKREKLFWVFPMVLVVDTYGGVPRWLPVRSWKRIVAAGVSMPRRAE